MTLFASEQGEQEAILMAAKMIMAAVTTSPKARGVSEIKSVLVQGVEKEGLAKAMEDHFIRKGSRLDIFRRDARNVRQASAILLIGVKGTVPKKPERPFNCGACGYSSCAAFMRAAKKKRGEDYVGPLCAFHVMDLGIALGVAAKVAAELNIDNRLFYTAGAAAVSLGYLDADLIIGLPLSVSAKNIFFDRS